MHDDAPLTLDALRPIHAAVPPLPHAALAMTLIGVLFGLLVAAALWPMLRRWRAVRRSALAELARLHALSAPERLAGQAKLLRRIVLTLEGDAPVRLRGAAWLAHLDDLFATDFFTRGAGACFDDSLYRRSPAPADPDAVDGGLASLFAGLRR